MNKIQALRAAAKAINEGLHYEWSRPESCNCGIVAQAVLGVGIVRLKMLLEPLRALLRECSQNPDPQWCKLASVACPATGLPMDEVFRSLYKAGFDRVDIAELEYLSNETVLIRAEISKKSVEVKRTETIKRSGFLWLKKEVGYVVKSDPYYTIAYNAARYMTAWADMLEESTKPAEDELEPQLKETAGRLLAKS